MSDHRFEIAARARLLIKRHGEPVIARAGRSLRLGIFYIRVENTGFLYINDQAHQNAPTVFIQRELDSTGTYHGWDPAGGYENYADRLISLLRQATILDELADV
jgi:hypothetical protein